MKADERTFLSMFSREYNPHNPLFSRKKQIANTCFEIESELKLLVDDKQVDIRDNALDSIIHDEVLPAMTSKFRHAGYSKWEVENLIKMARTCMMIKAVDDISSKLGTWKSSRRTVNI